MPPDERREIASVRDMLGFVSWVSRERQWALGEISWHRIIPARHRLAHEYDQIDDTIVWSIATRHIPTLITIVERVLSPDPPEPQDLR